MSRAPSLLCGITFLVIVCGAAELCSARNIAGGSGNPLRVPCSIGARSALAAPSAASESPRRSVDVIIGAAANEIQLLEPPLREMLAAKGLAVATTRKAAVTAQDVAAAIAPPSEATPPVARVLLDFTAPGQGTLFLIDPRRGRVHVRRMALAHGLDAVARASVRFVVEQSIDAILEGREIGVSREEFQRSIAAPPPPPAAPPPAPVPSPPTAPPPPPVESRLSLAAGYEGVALGSGEYQHAARIVFGARFARLRFAAAARIAAPVSIAGDGVQARLASGGVSLSGAARILSLENLFLSAGLGAGLDMTRVEPTVTMPDLQPTAAFWASGPLLLAFAEIERVFGRFSVALVAGAEAHLLAERYTVKTATETRDIFVPRRVRPAAAALVGVIF